MAAIVRAALAPLLLAAPVSAVEAQPDSLRGPRRLEPLVIAASRDSAGRLPFAASTLDGGGRARGRQGLGLDEVLAAVPGMSAQNRHNFALDTRLVVRGLGARSAFGVRGLTVLLDGVPQTLPDGQGQLTGVDPGTIARIDVLRGAAAAFYGNAAGGVLALWSPPLVGGDRHLRTRVVGGSFGLRRWEISARAPTLGGGAALDLSRSTIDGFRAHSAAELRHASAAVELPLSGAVSAAIRLRLADMPRADNPGGLTAAEVAQDPAQASARNVALRAGKRVRQWQGALDLRRITTMSDASVVVYGLARDLDNPLPSAFVVLDRTVVGSRLSARRSLGRGARSPAVLLGVDAQHQRDRRRNFDNDSGRAGIVPLVDQREGVGALGLRGALRMSAGSRSGAVVGARYDRVWYRATDLVTEDGDESGRRVMDAFSYTLGITRDVRRGLEVYANVGTAFETPTTTELATPGSGGFNPTLKPQHAKQREVGFRWLSGAAGGSVAFYQVDVRDGLLPYELADAPGRFVYRNAGRVRYRGLEAEASAQLSERLRLAVAHTLADNRFAAFPADGERLDGRFVPGVPLAYSRLVVQAGGDGGPWADGEARYASRTYADDANAARAGAWFVLDLRAGWTGQWAGRAITPFAAVRNVTGRRYSESVVVNAAAGRYFETAPGRNWYVGMEIAWRGAGASGERRLAAGRAGSTCTGR